MGKILLMLVLALLLTVPAKPVHAAEFVSGPWSISGTYAPNGMDLDGTTFTLYKVGEIDGKSFRLYKTYPVEINLDLDRDSFDDEEDWVQATLDSALTLSGYVLSDPEQEPVAEDTVANGSFRMNGLSNGLYLMVSDSVRVDGYDKDGTADPNKTSWWTSKPRLIAVLNGDRVLQPKTTAEDVSKFIVKKVWAGDDEVKDLVRPDSVIVRIYYGDDPTPVYSKILSGGSQQGTSDDTVEAGTGEGGQASDLPEPDAEGVSNWSFAWEADQEHNDPTKWFCVEELTIEDQKNYSVLNIENYAGDDEEDGKKIITITNTFSRPELEITKTMPDYVVHSGKVSPSLVFELTGYSEADGQGEQVYHKIVGLQYDPTTGPEQKLPVTNIPRNVLSLKVKEVYTGNTAPEDEETEKFAERTVLEDGTVKYIVEFENTYDNPQYSAGVINKFKMKTGGNGNSFEFDHAVGLGQDSPK